MTTATASTNPQHMEALAKANRIRQGGAEHRRWIAEGRLSIVDVLDPETPIPEVLESIPIYRLLTAQRRWGRERACRLLRRHMIGENRRVGALTKRERGLLVDDLREAEDRAKELAAA